MKRLLLLFILALNFGSAAMADGAKVQHQPYHIVTSSNLQKMAPQYLEVLVRSKLWVEPKFGPEFTFAGPQPEGASFRLIKRCHEHLLDNQCEGQKFLHDNSLFISPNGWDFTVEEDPGVIEVKMSPMTVGDYQKYQGDIQDAIFASASNIGFFPAQFTGGGHISISFSTFEENPLLLRNFIVDLYNHPELFMGVFNYDTHNALPLNQLRSFSLNALATIVEDFDTGRIGNVADLRVALSRVSGLYSDLFLKLWTVPNPKRSKLVAVNFERLETAKIRRRIELRGFRPQASMDVFTRQISLIRDRLKFLDSLNHPIDFNAGVQLEPQDPDKHKLNPPLDAQEALRAFHTFVKEAGHKWQDHRDYLWPEWISSGELEKFESSRWFHDQEGQGSCVQSLTLRQGV